ncbi:MAG TPA: transporter substrate-binding protein, partial [Polyangiaceae bacterium]|nr:transporter substrate-binding protein [Polyangiaceae bacterium]
MRKWLIVVAACGLLATEGCSKDDAAPAPAAATPSASASSAMATPAPAASAASGDTIKIGILHSLSGTMAISETSLRDVALMTIDEI